MKQEKIIHNALCNSVELPKVPFCLTLSGFWTHLSNSLANLSDRFVRSDHFSEKSIKKDNRIFFRIVFRISLRIFWGKISPKICFITVFMIRGMEKILFESQTLMTISF